MDFNDTAVQAEFRAEVQEWLAANAQRKQAGEPGKMALSDEAKLADAKQWQGKKAAAGWGAIAWPKVLGGRGGTPMEQVIWRQEVAQYDELDDFFTIGLGMCAPALMAFASNEQKAQYLPRLASGQDVWCQLFSEPSAGSDIAALRTTAKRDGDKWRINGQKVWTSGAHFADYGIVLCRTDPTVPKHKGLTLFFIDMKQPGVDARPIKQADGGGHFSEVFFNDAVVSDDQVLGEIGGGWKGCLTVLMNERLAVGNAQPTGFARFHELSKSLQINGKPAIDDGMVRSHMADWYVRYAGLKHTNNRILTALSKGAMPGPEGSIAKLVAAPMNQAINRYAVQLLGQAGVITDPTLARMQAHYQKEFLFSPGVRLAGGTDEVLRNIIAEQVLQMPQESREDKTVPFNELPTGL
ncbi:acyl-CoA dehydrogenase family protein [Ferrimonas pelagia]|uniref:Acyl-CoA dehydrogenase n=1 Tax=Ferrimonas pelagia TaxID=1177826 RepID=A0ABP9EG02_9GAMM